jgi:tetratricopeptide (TPR) repeat protein/predicted Ser/Thr protein kinase
MDAARWDRMQRLFYDALALPAGARAAHLAAACGADLDLLRRVTDLLDGDAAESLLDADTAHIASDLFDVSEPTAGIGMRVGPYRLISKLGEGGSGVVYLAERDDIGSRVAIKVLRDAWVSPDRRERFLREQRTLAQLNHPTIARIFDAGTLEGGTPWFAMEYVEGLPLDEYCRTHRTDTVGRMRLLRQICAAVQHAHERLVVHRDIKPSNILVTPEGAPKLLDFGISRHLENLHAASPHTGPLRFVSPGYAAPEEVRGEPSGVQADVFSLGVVLTELLAAAAGGRSWFGVGPHLGLASAADLDVMCATATHADTSRRYATADALLRDLDAFLTGRPLAAQPDSIGYRSRKFVGRHRRSIAAAAIVVACTGGVAWFYAERLAAARDATQAEAARTARLLRFVLGIFEEGENRSAPPADLRVAALLDRGVHEAQGLSDDPLVQAELFHTLGGIYQELGDLDRADRLLSDSLEARRTHLGADHADVVTSLVALGDLRLAQARLDEAERLVAEGRAMADRALAPEHPLHLRGTTVLGRIQREKGDYDAAARSLELAAARYAGRPADEVDLAQVLAALAETRFYMGQMTPAEEVNQRALQLTRRIRGADHPDLAHLLLNQGAIHLVRSELPQAEAAKREALGIFERWYGRAHPETASAMTILAQVLGRQARYEESLPLLREALATQEQTYGPDHPRTAFVLNELGLTALRMNDLAQAEPAFARAAAGYGKAAGTHFQEGISLVNLGRVYLARGDAALTERTVARALAIYADVLPPDHFSVAVANSVLGRALVRQRRFADAEPVLDAALRVLDKQPGPPSPWLTAARADLAETLEATGRAAQAAAVRAGTVGGASPALP